MTMPKKGRREITVGGALYHYKIHTYQGVVIQNTLNDDIIKWYDDDIKEKWKVQLPPSFIEEIILKHYEKVEK